MLRGILSMVAAFCLAMCASGCAGSPAESMAEVDPLGWSTSDTAKITIVNRDTTRLRTVRILMSYNDDFRGGGLPVRIVVGAPDGKYYSEQFVMYASSGPKKHSDFHESVMPYRDGVVFGIAGRYTFGISPLEEVEGIRAEGIKIE